MRQTRACKSKIDATRRIAEDKMEQNEDLAKLRAGVSLAKTGIDNKAIVMTGG